MTENNIDSMSFPSDFPPQDLEKILEILPKKITHAMFFLCGDFDYSSINPQVSSICQGLNLEPEKISFQLKNPTKEQIMKLYRHSYNMFHDGQFNEEAMFSGDKMNPRIALDRSEWFGDYYHIELTCSSLKVEFNKPGYKGKRDNFEKKLKELIDQNRLSDETIGKFLIIYNMK